jgi:hypothetical protein
VHHAAAKVSDFCCSSIQVKGHLLIVLYTYILIFCYYTGAKVAIFFEIHKKLLPFLIKPRRKIDVNLIKPRGKLAIKMKKPR